MNNADDKLKIGRDWIAFVVAWIPYSLLTYRFWHNVDDAFISFRYAKNWAMGYGLRFNRRCCTARSKSLTSLCRLQSHPAQYVSGIPSAAILLSISHPIRCSTRCLANVRARISGPMIAL